MLLEKVGDQSLEISAICSAVGAFGSFEMELTPRLGEFSGEILAGKLNFKFSSCFFYTVLPFRHVYIIFAQA